MRFNSKRFLILLKHDLTVYSKPILYGSAGIFLLIITISGLINIGADNGTLPLNHEYWSAWLVFLVMVACLLLTSAIYWEFKENSSRLQYLILPASNFEKTLTRWLYTLLLAPLLCFILLYLARLVMSFSEHSTEYFMNYGDVLPPLILIYAISHALMFMFAIWFNKYVAPKASIISFLVFILSAIILAGEFSI